MQDKKENPAFLCPVHNTPCILHQSHTAQDVQPSCHGKCAEQCSEHDHTGCQHAFVAHVPRHHVTAHCCGGAEHNKNSHQFFPAETEPYCKREKKRREQHQLHRRCSHCGLRFSKRFFHLSDHIFKAHAFLKITCRLDPAPEVRHRT